MAKIVITSNTLEAGGAERQRVYLANWLSRNDHSVELRLLQKRGRLESIVDRAVPLVDGWEKPGPTDWVITGTTNTEVAFALLCLVLKKAKRWSIAVHNPVSSAAPMLSPLPFLALTFAHDVIALTPRHAAQVREHWGIAPTHIVSNGISVPSVRPEPMGSGRLGYIGRLSLKHKGLDRLLQAVAATNDVHLLVAGEGPDKGALSRLVEELGAADRVTFLGGVEPYPFYSQCAAIAVLSRWEAQPLVLLESRWVGVPVVLSRELAEESDKFVVDADDISSVKRGIHEALTAGWQRPDESISDSLAEMGAAYAAILAARPKRSGRVISLRSMLNALARTFSSRGGR
ncbi:glycosyltransferase [Microbacterium sp. BH-3-3-3]|uniref:glycosyltransferase n=1 Tax=Microbacterium sp. BH-3-3-3 TaxID=1906742 RepID=UPI0016435914|nr:glycosyltransferase [Microbacterium sp. BH-3-3-3]